MLHLLAYASTTSADPGYVKVNALEDGWLYEQDGAFIFPQPTQIYTWWMSRNQTNSRRFRLEASTWRRFGSPTFSPALGRVGVVPSPINIPLLKPPARLTIPKLDPVYAFVEDAAGGALTTAIGIVVGDGNYGINSGEMFTLKFTSSVTLNTLTWSQGLLTPELPLPPGRYQVVGMYIFTATNLPMLARLVFQNQGNRPGLPFDKFGPEYFAPYYRYGNLGTWGEFEHTQIPVLEILSATAGAAGPDVDLDLIKIR